MIIEFVVGLQLGDESKGAVTAWRQQQKRYDVVARVSGGPNAGHTIIKDGVTYVTHSIPSGVIFDNMSLISAGCVLNPEKFFEELAHLKSLKPDLDESLIKIAYNTHIITNNHIKDDKIRGQGIGSTFNGISPAYVSKYAREGIRAKDVGELSKYIIDPRDIWTSSKNVDASVLVEGAQGYGLCPDWGDYPFVTSSPPTTAYALHSLGIGLNFKRDDYIVYGCAKPYETYSGYKEFEPKKEVFKKLREIGSEYGATTGRPRQCNWLDLKALKTACEGNGVDFLIFSKIDVLTTLNHYEIRSPKKTFSTFGDMQMYIEDFMYQHFGNRLVVLWSGRADKGDL